MRSPNTLSKKCRFRATAVLALVGTGFFVVVSSTLTFSPYCVDAFLPLTSSTRGSISRPAAPLFKAGFGSPLSSARNKKGKKAKDKKKGETPAQAQQRWANKMKKVYGGTSSEEIAAGTEKRISYMMETSLDEATRKGLELREIVQVFERRITGMGPEEIRQRYSQEELETAIQNRRTFEEHMESNSLTPEDLQVAMQKVTWDASADAKAFRSVTGTMPTTFKNRVTKASEMAYESISKNDLVLDVGCGYGVLVPFLKKAGFNSHQIHGVDLSSQMIRHARTFYPDVASEGSFEAMDFFAEIKEDKKNRYRSVVFCSSLHDLPDLKRALLKTKNDLLDSKPGSRIVIVHAQGASHVMNQNKQNPLLVPRNLPTSNELKEWLCEDGASMKLVHEPAEPKSQGEVREGYLAVLEMV